MQHHVEPLLVEKPTEPPGLLLTPVSPSSIPRYDRPVRRKSDWFHPGKYASRRASEFQSEQIADGWTECTTPEGDNYFRNTECPLVTYTDIRVQSAERWLRRAYGRLIEMGRARDPQITKCEAYIHIVLETPVSCQLEYYFIDPSARHPFWVHEVRVQDLGLPDFETPDHLKAILTPEFWVHIEYFAVHHKLEKSVEDELIAIFRHGCADAMTSFGSTFPYSAQECREHLQTLEGFIASGEFSGCRTAAFARLWASVTRVRHINGYSLPGPRLDRSQRLEEFKKGQRPGAILRVLNTLLLALPQSKFDRITELWNGRVVFQRHWHSYFDDQRSEWLRLAVLGFAVFIVAVILIVADGQNLLAVISASLAAGSVMSALTLHERHSRSKFNTASDIILAQL
ncbi:hypothetical protein FRC01_008262 [Tulasnella sp. 417]|nr:hypothetical protein FRC01_008262 [Tulasnella sp. 417]